LLLKGLAATAEVHDLFGAPEPDAKAGSDLRVPVNELVRYVVAPAATRETLLAAIEIAEPTGP
jgi:hypothetical protein